MPLPLRRVILTLLCLILAFHGASAQPAVAQEAYQASLASLDSSAFPRITTYLDVRSPEGKFVYGLGAEDIIILEDGLQLPTSELNQLRPGAQFVLAVGPGTSFDIRDAQGLNRYDYLVQAFEAWAGTLQGSTIDDLSFLAGGGPESTHLAAVEAWVAVLKSYKLAVQETVSGFDVLARALEIAADPTPRPGMRRAVLFLTSIPETDASVGLQSLAARAVQRGVQIFVWFVAPVEQFASPGASQLAEMAAQTGGSSFGFSGVESFPDLEEYLEPLRSTYSLAYDSHIASSGTHQVSAQVLGEGFEAFTPVQEFDLEVLLPVVTFDSPPVEITRTAPPEAEPNPENLTPKVQTLEVLVEVPDAHPRPITRSALSVDGTVVDVNLSAPFEQFIWDLSDYTTTGQHLLKAEAQDSLGLSGTSVEIPVVISLEQPSESPLTTISQNRTLVAVLAATLAGAVLVLVLILGGRLRPGSLREVRRRRRRSDPVTQPVRVKTESPPQRRSRWMGRLHWPQRRTVPKAFAYLIRLSESEQADSSPPIPIVSDEITFGSDPTQATQVLEDGSVDSKHACLRREEHGAFRLSDEGSTAGTWINYTPVSQEGMRLEHGDLIHIGRVGFRFVLREPGQTRKPVTRPKEPAP
ncbi:MAG TPA: FHA domain-containing protein [Anaerolineales bacterium]|nr:FHA domain-containing protein [Anaerolineales bacterium]